MEKFEKYISPTAATLLFLGIAGLSMGGALYIDTLDKKEIVEKHLKVRKYEKLYMETRRKLELYEKQENERKKKILKAEIHANAKAKQIEEEKIYFLENYVKARNAMKLRELLDLSPEQIENMDEVDIKELLEMYKIKNE